MLFSPAPGPDGLLDAATTEIRVDFSAPMAHFTGTDYGPGGAAQ